jgi:hypothetical protein
MIDIVSKLTVSREGDRLYVTDKTGAYSATNITGWGAPNISLDQHAIAALIQRVDETTENHVVVGVDVRHAQSGEAYEHQFEFEYLKDGDIRGYLFALKVTTDGTNYLSGGTVQDGDYFYYDGVKQRVSGLNVDVTDYSVFIDDVNIPQGVDSDLMLKELGEKHADLYLDYSKSRDEDGDLKDKSRDLYDDLFGAYKMYWTGGNTVGAVELVNKLYETYGL